MSALKIIIQMVNLILIMRMRKYRENVSENEERKEEEKNIPWKEEEVDVIMMIIEEEIMKNLVWLNLKRIFNIDELIISQPIVNENPYGALGDDSEEEDTSVCTKESSYK